MTLTREIKFYRAYDKRDADPKKNFGIHGVELAFYLKGPEGIVQFKLYTNWQLPHVQKEMNERPPHPRFPYMFHEPMPLDLGYHSPRPLYEGQTPISRTCELLGGTCYYDGSTLNAEPVFNILVAEGEEAVWNYLENYYKETFLGR